MIISAQDFAMGNLIMSISPQDFTMWHLVMSIPAQDFAMWHLVVSISTQNLILIDIARDFILNLLASLLSHRSKILPRLRPNLHLARFRGYI
jgi:hypothetical protein